MKFPPHQGSILSLSPTICYLLGVEPPTVSEEPALDMVISTLDEKNLPLEKCLIIAQDALGAHLWESHESEFSKILPFVPLQVPLRSVIPPVTPVCFASIFSGAQPDVHGIHHYTRPILECDTIFDALLRAKKRVAIVSVVKSSIDMIFRNRAITYFAEEDDLAVKKRALEVIQSDKYDFILVYQADYDDNLHETEPFSPICIEAFKQHIQDFMEMAAAANEHWKDRSHVIAFTPDHGAHIDPSTGKGDHGVDIPEDMNLFHCYGIYTE